MSQNILNDISKVYLEKIALDEAVRGQDIEMRKTASQERQAERKERGGAAPKIPGREGPSAGKSYADYQHISMRAHDKATKGKFIPGMVNSESLDPVGKEDSDIDNDGKSNTKSDKYLLNRRKVRGASIKKESFSNWRQDLVEVIDKIQKEEGDSEIKEKKIENKIIINPEFKEAVEELGGVLLETVEVEEGYKPINKEKESAMYRRAGNLARTSLSSRGKKKEEAQTKSSKIVSAITRQKENERFDRIGQSPAHNEEFVSEEDPCWDTHKQVGMKKKGNRMVPNCVPKNESVNPAQQAAIAIAMKKSGKKPKNEEVELDEKTLTPAETKKKEEIVMSMKKSSSDFEKRYPGRGKEVMYATATKNAKKIAEADMPQETQDTNNRAKAQQKQKLLQILQQKERAVRAGMVDISASYEEEGEVIDEKTRYAKETGKSFRTGKPVTPGGTAKNDKAFQKISKLMGSSRLGVQPRGQKKVPGKKKPFFGQSPAQRVANRRASAQNAQDMMHSKFD